MKLGHGRGAFLAVALCAGALGPVFAVGTGSSGIADAALQPKVVLPQAPPTLPAHTAHLGAAPANQVLDLDVVLAGQDPAGLAQEVAAISTPGSPQYRHYLTESEFAAEYGPTASEVQQVSSDLREEGLSVGTYTPGSVLLPVNGAASVVSAAFGTALEQVQTPDGSRAVVNTGSPAVPSSMSGLVTGVAGLNGLFREHSMLRRNTSPSGASSTPGSSSQSRSAPAATPETGQSQSHAVVAHAAPPQPACAAAADAAALPGIYTSTEMSSIFGLNQLFAQGRTGLGQTIAIVEFEKYALSDFQTFQSCYGLTNSIRNVNVDGGPLGVDQGLGEAALDTELAAYNAPSAALVVYGAPNGNDAAGLDLYQKIASDDTAQVVTTSWGSCEAALTAIDAPTEYRIFQQMAVQGQTVIAASGDTGSEDCFGTGLPNQDALAVDDPGSQPDVVSAGGTSISGMSPASQAVWNCSTCGTGSGAGGGGYSTNWAINPGQTKPMGFSVGNTDPCSMAAGCRAVPDISYPADPESGSVVDYFTGPGGGGWGGIGGTSVAAPTNAGLFADTNQGCFNPLGRVGAALYAAELESSSNFTDIQTGNNDYTGTNLGEWGAGTGYDPASGLGTPIDQNLAIALQGADGCPSVASLSTNTGPVSGGGAITITGGGFANASAVTFGSIGVGQITSQSETSITVIPPNASSPVCVDVTVANSQGISATSAADHYGFGGNLNCGQGYRFVASDGGVFDFGDASFWGSTGAITLNKPVVGMASTPSTNGYWLVASDGGLFSYGDARFFGSMGGKPLNKPIVGMASTPNGGGYWEVASDGGIFSFGNAQFYGSTGAMHLNRPIVAMASTPDGLGYWLVASDGGIFAYGDAQFYGSTGGMTLNSPIVGMASGPSGAGYWLVASDGGIFAYGSAQFHGSAGGIRLNRPVVGMAATPDDGGYWLVASDGGIFTYGDAPFFGSTGGISLNRPIVGMSSS